MRKEDYKSTAFGAIAQDHYKSWPHGYFMPNPIDRYLKLSSETYNAVSAAQLELGKLAGLAQAISNPDVLLAPTMLFEALSSSRIEGTQASLSEVLSVEDQPTPIMTPDLREVWNYLNALKLGLLRLKSLPITQRLFCELHEVLLSGVRGEGKEPGHLRNSQVWVGSGNTSPENARYIPPLHNFVSELLRDWELYVNEDLNIQPVIRAAMMHYQFETIHPFLDGNGRMGRLLISLQLIKDGVLDTPVLNISSYIERFKTEYYERLQGVRENGQIDEWIQFFAKAITEQSVAGTSKINHLIKLQKSYESQIVDDRTGLRHLINMIFSNPIVTVKKVQTTLEISQPSTSKMLKKAEELGWVTLIDRSGRGGKQTWYAKEIWKVTSDETIS